MATSLGPVPLKASIVDGRGLITQVWAAWFRDLLVRVGSFEALSNVELESVSILATTGQFTVANNQSSFANVTGLLFSGSTTRSFDATVNVYRYASGGGGSEIGANLRLRGVYKSIAGSWEMTVDGLGDDIQDFGLGGLLFQITSGGQVQYKSHSQGGTPVVSKLKFSYTTVAVES